MDPLAHTLVGAGLAATGLHRRARFATLTLVIGANLPDVDAFATFLGGDRSLALRRGWTHGVLAMVVLPLCLAWFFAWLARRREPDRDAFAPLLLLSCLSVWSHPCLDWLNTYGVRLLMPFDGAWFYGDTLFIVDPWLWLMAGTATFAGARGRRSLGRAVGLAVAASVILLWAPIVPIAAKLAWILGLASAAIITALTTSEAGARRVARAALGGLAIYVGLMFVGNRAAQRIAAQSLADPVVEFVVGPLAASPWRRDVIVVMPDRYRFGVVDLLRGTFAPGNPEVAKHGDGPIVAAALAHPSIQGFRNWLRFPAFTVTARDDGYTVTIRDQRYARLPGRGFGTVVVALDRELNPVAPPASGQRILAQ